MITRHYRERHEIIAAMLHTVIDSGIAGTSRTPLMYRSFLSYAQLKGYLPILLIKGLIKEYPPQNESEKNEEIGKEEIGKDPNHRLNYTITEKGRRVLQICDEINKIIEPAQAKIH
jgi:predicted transcriptional regulator